MVIDIWLIPSHPQVGTRLWAGKGGWLLGTRRADAYIYTCIHRYIYTSIHIHIHIYTYIHIYMYTYKPTYIYTIGTYMCIRILKLLETLFPLQKGYKKSIKGVVHEAPM